MRVDVSGFKVRLDAAMIEHYMGTGGWTGRTLGDYAREALAEAPDAALLIDGGRVWSRAEIFELASRLGAALHGRGLRAGDTISSQLPNWYETSVINLAAAMYGFVINPIVPIQRDREVSFSLAESGSKMIFIPWTFRNHDYAAMLERIAPLVPGTKMVIVRDAPEGRLTFADLLAEGAGITAPPPEIDPNSIKMLMYTSGTTGRAKGVLHTHNTLMAEIVSSFVRFWGTTPRDMVFMASPVSHITGTILGLELPWVARTCAVLMDVWSADAAVELILRHGCTVTSAATVFLQELIIASQKAGTSLPTMRLFACGGAPIAPSLIRTAYATWPSCLTVRVYGSTEAPSVTHGTLLDYDPENAATTDGRVRNWEVKICDQETGALCPPGEAGEILVRGPELFVGYTQPEDTAAAFDDEGYFRTGDVGKLVKGDYLMITDRKKDLIIRGGENLSAKEIEDALSTYPGLRVVAAVGMPCPRMGETVCIFVEADDDARLDKESIARFMIAQNMAKQKIPERVERIAAMPRTASGKIRKNVLREEIAKLIGAPTSFQTI